MTSLAFDPYAAIAEIENQAGLGAKGANRAKVDGELAPLAQLAPVKVAERILREADSGTIGTIEPKGEGDGPNVPKCPIVPAAPDQALALWLDGLKRLDQGKPCHGYSGPDWFNLCDDAGWLFAKFGRQAASEGWGTADLFGIIPGKPGWGGVADRLRGSRSLVLTGDRAHWRSWGQVERYNRGAYPDLLLMWGKA